MPTQIHTVTIAQALIGNAVGLLVFDTAANIASALPNNGLVARVTSFTVTATTATPVVLTVAQMLTLSTLGGSLHAPAGSLKLNSAVTVTAAQLVTLEAMPGFGLGTGASITLSDSTANIVGLLANHPAYFAQVAAVSIHLDGTSIGAYPAGQLNGLAVHGKALSFVSSPGFTTLNVASAAHDLGSNAAALNQLAGRQALTFTLTNEGSAVSATDAAGLTTLTGFHIASHTLTVADTAGNIATGAGQIFGQGFTQIKVTSGTFAADAPKLLDPTLQFSTGAHALLTASVTLGVAASTALAALPGISLANGVALSILDTAANLAVLSSSTAAFASNEMLSATATISASTALALSGLAHLNLAGNSLTVADTLPALLGMSAPAVTLAHALVLSTDATASATQISLFAALPHVSLGSHLIAVVDSAANLLTLSAPALAMATSLTLSQDATLGVADFNSLRALQTVSAGGHAVAILDSATNLAGLTGNLSLAGLIELNGSSTVSASQMAALASLQGFSLNGSVLDLTDTATHLLTLAPAALALANSVTLSANATVSVAQAETLFAEPGFSIGSHHLIVADTAAALLSMPTPLQLAATTLTLSASQSVDAASLTHLAGLGIKFSEAGHALTCTDSATALAGLSTAALALASAEVLASPSTVSAATALTLSTLRNLSLAPSAALIVQDTVANLIAVGNLLPLVTSSVQLPPGSAVTLSAADAKTLSGIPHFSAANAAITVADTVANLTGAADTGWQSVAGAVHVVDTAANLAANASTQLLHTASLVTLSGNATINASAAAQIAGIGHFVPGAFQLLVSDTAGDIAGAASAIVQLGTNAMVTDPGPVTAAVADRLATVSAAGLLTFLGGDQLLVEDSYAALTSNANLNGLALASRLGVIDVASNLVVAAGHDWGALNPSFTLSQGGVIQAAQAVVLAGLNTHYSANGFTLTVADNAANVVAATTALAGLHITAAVSDSTANLAAQEAGLLALGSALTLIQDTDTGSVNAALGASIAGLAAKLSGPALQVTDTAAHVDTNLPALATLGNHVSIIIVDSAAAVANVAADLANLHSALTIQLNDVGSISASAAAGLAPVQTNLLQGASIGVSDTGEAIAAHASGLASLGNHLGLISLSDGSTQTASVAAGLVSIDSHLAPDVMLTAIGTGADVIANSEMLLALKHDHRLAEVVVSHISVDDAVANASALNALSAQVTVSDMASAVDGGLAALSALDGLTSVQLTDSGVPALSMTIATLTAEASVLSKISTPYTVTITDSAAHISADIASGPASAILSHLSAVGQLTTSDSLPIALTQSQILFSGVDDGPEAALTKFVGPVSVTGVDVAHLAQVAGLDHAPNAISVTDSSAAIGADLAQGSASALLLNLTSATSISSVDHAAVTLTATQALAAGVDDGPASAIGKLQGAPLAVTDASISQLASLAGLNVQASSIAVLDTAAEITSDLASGASKLMAGLPTITAISVLDGQTIYVTEQRILAAHVDDGPGSILSEVTGGSLAVTNVAAADIAELLGLAVAPAKLSITDSAAHLVSSLSTVLADIASVSSINITGQALTLTANEVLELRVDDGPQSLVSKLANQTFNVSGSSVTQLGLFAQLTVAPSHIGIVDSSSNVVADLISGHSSLAQNAAAIGSISVNHGVLTLTSEQAAQIYSTPLIEDIFSKLAPTTVVSVTGASVSDVALLNSNAWPHLAIAVADTPAAIAADLSLGINSMLLNSSNGVMSVSLSASGDVNAATLTAMVALPGFSEGAFALGVQDAAAAIAGLGQVPLSFVTSISVSDSAADVTTALDALQMKYAGALTITLNDASPSVTVDVAHFLQDRATLEAITNPHVVTVTGSASEIAPIAAELGTDPDVAAVRVTDSASNIVANLGGLNGAGLKLGVTLTDTSLAANLIVPLMSIANLAQQNIPIVDSGSQIAQLANTGNVSAVAYLNSHTAVLSGNSVVSASDAATLEGLSGFHVDGYFLQVWDTPAHLLAAAYQAALSNAACVSAVYLKTLGNVATMSVANAMALFQIPNFSTTNPDGSQNSILVNDTVAHIEANYALLSSLEQRAAGVSGVIVSTSAVITGSTLSDLQALGAVAHAGVSLQVRDTAQVILASISHPSGSVIPNAWQLSTDGLVSEAQAVTLGSMSNFSAGGHTLTLNVTSDTLISLADAQALGHIASSLSLNGHHLIVDGTVAQLSALSPAALGLVTPALADSLTNIAVLPMNSTLLSGTVEVTGGDSLNATSAEAFLNLVHPGVGGPGISSASLTMDSWHWLNDTVANLRTLTSSPGWTANPDLHHDFALVARDTLATLINPDNTAFLAGLSVSGLADNAIVNASSASSLASLAGTIHYQADHNITVQDTAANLLDVDNAAGLSMAQAITLAGPSVVDAADAEGLLSLNHFIISTPLIVRDSSANLLDGALGQAVTSSAFSDHVQLQLAGPETLDADTAESLVSLPRFSDPINLSIADSPSYLLASANLSAEQMASTVTLDGDEAVSANTILRLSEVPHFTPGTSHLVLAGNDFADAATLRAIVDVGGAFTPNGHTITVTQDALDLSPAEFAAAQSDNLVANNHVGILPGAASLFDAEGALTVSATGYAGGIVKAYSASGALVSVSQQTHDGFIVTIADNSAGQNFAITETVHGTEGAPLVILDAVALGSLVTAAGATFASNGSIQISPGAFVNLYEAGSVPNQLTNPALVYDPVAHTVSLDLPHAAPVTLITLGSATHPMSLDPSEILSKQHG